MNENYNQNVIFYTANKKSYRKKQDQWDLFPRAAKNHSFRFVDLTVEKVVLENKMELICYPYVQPQHLHNFEEKTKTHQNIIIYKGVSWGLVDML